MVSALEREGQIDGLRTSDNDRGAVELGVDASDGVEAGARERFLHRLTQGIGHLHNAHRRQHFPGVIPPAAMAIHSHSYPIPIPIHSHSYPILIQSRPAPREVDADADGSAGVHGSGGSNMHDTVTQAVGRNPEEGVAEVQARRLPMVMESELINRGAPPSRSE
jgi:hypothetical protein